MGAGEGRGGGGGASSAADASGVEWSGGWLAAYACMYRTYACMHVSARPSVSSAGWEGGEEGGGGCKYAMQGWC